MSRLKWNFMLITFIIGFMLAVQFETIQHPAFKDTRDEVQLRESLKSSQDTQVQLLKEIQKYEQQLDGYKTKLEGNKEDSLQKTLQDLQEQAGRTDMTGSGIVLQLKPLLAEQTLGQVPNISPQLLQRLVNELNTYGAIAIQIADQRVVPTTAIRDVNGKVSVNNVPLPSLPIEVRVIAKDSQKIYDRMKVSTVFDYFAIDNIDVSISKSNSVSIQKNDQPIRTANMKAVESEGK